MLRGTLGTVGTVPYPPVTVHYCIPSGPKDDDLVTPVEANTSERRRFAQAWAPNDSSTSLSSLVRFGVLGILGTLGVLKTLKYRSHCSALRGRA